tara:strand:- start:5 stop:154 length:150 start_codon:yes stop_codon:yes gene_type:complete
MYKEIVERERISYLHANNGVIELGYADGTKEVYKKSKWRNKYIKIRSRT